MTENQNLQEQKVGKPSLFTKLKNNLKQYKRVLTVARKPGREEFLLSSKITGAGIIFLGLIGFVIFLIYYLALAVPGV